MPKFTPEELKKGQDTLADSKIGEDLLLSALCDAVTKLRDENAKLIEQVKAKDIELSAIPKEKPIDRDLLLARAELYEDRVNFLVEKGKFSKHFADKVKSQFKTDRGDPNVLLLSREPGQSSSVADLLLSILSEFEPGVDSKAKSGVQELSRQVPAAGMTQPTPDVKDNPLVKLGL